MAIFKKEHINKLDEAMKNYIETRRIKLSKDPNNLNIHIS